MATPSYYGDQTQPDRKKQAVQSALVSDQNMVAPPKPAGPLGPRDSNGDVGTQSGTKISLPTQPEPPRPLTPVDPGGQPSAPGGPQLGPAPVVQNPTDWLSVINQFKGMYQPQALPSIPSEAQMQMDLLRKVLGAPDVFNAQQVQQMQEAQKEYLLSTQQADQQKLLDRYAGQGRYGSGQQAADERRLSDSTTGQVLQSNRDIGLQSSKANFQSRLDALSMGNDVIGKQEDFALKNALSQEGLQQDQIKLALQAALGTSGMTLDQWKAMLAAFTQLGIFNTSQTNQTNAGLGGI